ncbi:MAG: saccharopine dehydrogenase family protein [Alphaproteobacteria bacterium]
MQKILVYGANGYTGKLMLAEAGTPTKNLVLAGRNSAALADIGQEYGYDWQAVPLDDADALRAAVGACDVVLHLAGPYRHTAAPMRTACLDMGKHYVDITGELSVFADHASYDAAAKEAGIVLLSGAGFDVVPSDCLIRHVADKIENPTDVAIYFSGGTGMTRGTMRSGLAGLFAGFPVRRAGNLSYLGKPIMHQMNVAGTDHIFYSAGWGDLETAWHSSRIPNITCFFERKPGFGMGGPFAAFTAPLLKSKPGQAVLNRIINSLPEGPTDEERAAATQTLIAVATNEVGDKVAAKLVTPEAYTLTGWSCLKAAEVLLDGGVPAGYHTPASAFGAGFVETFPGVTLTDIDVSSDVKGAVERITVRA